MISSERLLEHRVRNGIHSALLMGSMLALLALLGWLLAGIDGLFLLMVFGFLFAYVGPQVSPHWILRLYHARPLSPAEVPMLYRIVEVLAARAGLEQLPQLCYIPSPLINAFAVGRRRDAIIGVTDGLLRTLDQRELAGVLAHEISHILHDDLRVMGVADAISRMTHLLANLGQLLLLFNLPMMLLGQYHLPWMAILILILAPMLSSLLQLALSRTREFEADLEAARLTGDPRGLASALAKMERLQAHWLERLLFPGRRVPDPSLFRTHPETEERIRRLLELEGTPAPQWQAIMEELPLMLFDPSSFPRLPHRTPRWRITGLWY